MRILIVDDHPIVASGCRAVFAGDSDVELLEARDADDGLRTYLAERPDVCVVDINLPTVSGFELVRRIMVQDARAAIVMFSMNDDPVFAARAIEAGARGYVSKNGNPNDLREAVHEIRRGGTYLPAAIARSLAFAGPALSQCPLSKLNAREIEILRLLGAGKSLAEIAWMVQASYKTVANTSSLMRQKLGIRSSGELVRFAIERGVA
jgi:two-component system, NarL family, invasion response regulator UvrY